MSDFFSTNLSALREYAGENQEKTAQTLGLTRSTYANYEGGANLPKADVILKIVRHFGVSFENLMLSDLRNAQVMDKIAGAKNAQPFAQPAAHLTEKIGQKTYSGVPQVVTVDSDGKDRIVHVPVKARAGYLSGYGDPEYIESLPNYNLPFLRSGIFRSFEAEGHSMKPTLLHHDYVVGQYVEELKDIRENRVHIIVTHNDGILIKRVLNRVEARNKLYLKSDTVTNKSDYPIIELDEAEVAEIWYARIRFTPDFSEPSDLYNRLNDLELDLFQLKKHFGFIQ